MNGLFGHSDGVTSRLVAIIACGLFATVASAGAAHAQAHCEGPNAHEYSLCGVTIPNAIAGARNAYEAGDRTAAIRLYESALGHPSARTYLEDADFRRMEQLWAEGLGTASAEKLFQLRQRVDPQEAAMMLARKEVPIRGDTDYLPLLAMIYDGELGDVTELMVTDALKGAVAIYLNDPVLKGYRSDMLPLMDRLAERGLHDYAIAAYQLSNGQHDLHLAGAAAAGNPTAQYLVGSEFLRNADSMVQSKSWEEALSASESAKVWFDKAAAQGFENASNIAAQNDARIATIRPRAQAAAEERRARVERARAEAAERAAAKPVDITWQEAQRAIHATHSAFTRAQLRAIFSVGGAWDERLMQCDQRRCRYLTFEMWVDLVDEPTCSGTTERAHCVFDYVMRVENLLPHMANPFLNAIGASMIQSGSGYFEKVNGDWVYLGG